MDYIFIEKKSDVINMGRVFNQSLEEYYIEDLKNKSIVGHIYRARVEKIVKGIHAAFVDIGLNHNGYLPLGKQIDNIKGGDTIFVEVKKDPVGDKGALLSQDITLTGNYIILTPKDKSIKFSKKINEKEEINRLRLIGDSIKKDDIGLIFRTHSEDISKEKINEEYLNLVDKYIEIKKSKNFLPIPKLVSKADLYYIEFLKNITNKSNYKIISNNEDVISEIKEEIGLLEKFRDIEYKNDFDIRYIQEIHQGISNALDRVVINEDKISIVIDELEALTAIDINSAGYKGNINLDETKFLVNKKIIPEIARQIKLRNLSGIILIDFLSMSDKRNNRILMELLEDEFKDEKNQLNILGFTKLGMLETTRKRERLSLKKSLGKSCEKCKGLGLLI